MALCKQIHIPCAGVMARCGVFRAGVGKANNQLNLTHGGYFLLKPKGDSVAACVGEYKASKWFNYGRK